MLDIFITFLALVLPFGLVCGFFLRRTIFYDLLHVPKNLYNFKQAPIDNMLVKKVFFGNHDRQYLLFCTPRDGKTTKNNVIFFHHGGAWTIGSPELFLPTAQLFVEAGYFVVLPSYRRVPKHNYYDIREDISSGLLKALEMLKEAGVGDKRLILGGMSAGGNIVGLLFFDRQELSRLGLSQELFSGLFVCGAPLDLKKMRYTPILQTFAGKRTSEMFRKASPIEHIQADESLPVWCLHGEDDGLVPYQVALSFTEKLNAVNPGIVEFHTIERGIHTDAIKWVLKDNLERRNLMRWIEERE